MDYDDEFERLAILNQNPYEYTKQFSLEGIVIVFQTNIVCVSLLLTATCVVSVCFLSLSVRRSIYFSLVFKIIS